MARVKLRFNTQFPVRLEEVLKKKYGFRLYQYRCGEFIIFDKDLKPNPVANFDDITDDIEKVLLGRVNKIADCFEDFEKSKDLIAIRCRNLAKTLEPKQRAWVERWVDRTCEAGKAYGSQDVPWEDGPVAAAKQGKLL